ncbi:MAG: NAD(P)/FAD-dependent oxidoreductase [Bacillota bacterium]
MRISVSDIRLELEEDAALLKKRVARRLGVLVGDIDRMSITRQAVDARRNRVSFVYTLDVELEEGKFNRRALADPKIMPVEEEPGPVLIRGSRLLLYPPVIVGAGPAGLFAALKLARWGFRPVVLERGRDVVSRTRDVQHFWETGELDTTSNVQFGEGGAGSFSDGKLTTRIKSGKVREVLEDLVAAGAPEEILYENKPHIGTDLLRQVVLNLRRMIIEAGGRVLFQARVSDFALERSALAALIINDRMEVPTQVAVLAIGHSARDTYQALERRGIALEAKAFAIGVRVEHPQKLIDNNQYGRYAGHPRLGAADYHLVYRSHTGKTAYTFCMCPGGYVIAAASEAGGVVTNGMSEHGRGSGIANSAVVVAVGEDDFGDIGPLAGVVFQRHWEQAAFRLGGSNYRAPAQLVGDFIADRSSTEVTEGTAGPTYRPGISPANLRECLPGTVAETLGEALVDFDRKIKGFADPSVVMTGVETRSSAPVRIIRGEDRQSLSTRGLYPVGEGAGYAGGIISAAVDGINSAEAIIETYAIPEGHLPDWFPEQLPGKGD